MTAGVNGGDLLHRKAVEAPEGASHDNSQMAYSYDMVRFNCQAKMRKVADFGTLRTPLGSR